MGQNHRLFARSALAGKVSVVTGAGKGLGKTMALALAHAGSDMVLVARHQEDIDATAKEMATLGGNAVAIRADVTRSDEITRMVEKAVTTFGKIDILVNNAGQNARQVHHKFEETPEAEWNSMIQTNITGVYLVTKIVGRAMLKRGYGRVINIASSWGVRPVPEFVCYSVTKAAVIQMTRALAVEWAPRGVTVNCIAPGSMDKSPDSTDPDDVAARQKRAKLVPLGRLGRPDELGPALIYLASDASSYMTGTTLFVDGGMAVG
jgi:NAD(P)-dependent dehydrogenase (short-subunit alcohol dehydrogenase family)